MYDPGFSTSLAGRTTRKVGNQEKPKGLERVDALHFEGHLGEVEDECVLTLDRAQVRADDGQVEVADVLGGLQLDDDPILD